MGREAVFLLFFSAILANAYEKCPFREKFLTQSKVDQFVDEHNRIRDEVAQAKLKNPDGKLQYGSNMNYLVYNPEIARKAQDCSDRCPQNDKQCTDIALGLGVLVYDGDIWAGGADWFPKRIMHHWVSKTESFRQIVQGDVTRFGCGRVQSDHKGTLRESVVCFYDVKTNSNYPPYKYGPLTSNCINGRKQGYLGLCNSGRRNFIHQEHKGMKTNEKLHHNSKNQKQRKHKHSKHSLKEAKQ